MTQFSPLDHKYKTSSMKNVSKKVNGHFLKKYNNDDNYNECLKLYFSIDQESFEK